MTRALQVGCLLLALCFATFGVQAQTLETNNDAMSADATVPQSGTMGHNEIVDALARTYFGVSGFNSAPADDGFDPHKTASLLYEGASDDARAAYELVAHWAIASLPFKTAIHTSQSDTVLRDTRAQLIVWRDALVANEDVNMRRVDTIAAEISVLGTPPETGTEAPEKSILRANLNAQKAAMASPATLVRVASAEAEGLIAEIDAIDVERKGNLLQQRSLPVYDPISWTTGLTSGIQSLSLISDTAFAPADNAVGMSRQIALLVFVIGLALMFGARKMIKPALAAATHDPDNDGRAIGGFTPRFYRFLSELLKLAGFWLSIFALTHAHLFGADLIRVLETLPYAAAIIWIGCWLVRELNIPTDTENDVWELPEALLKTLQNNVDFLVWGTAVMMVLGVVFETLPSQISAQQLLALPLLVLLSVAMLRISAQLISEQPNANGFSSTLESVARLVGWGLALTSIGVILLGLTGYIIAADVLMSRSIYTLGVLVLAIISLRALSTILDDTDDNQVSTVDTRDNLVDLLAYLALLIGLSSLLAVIWVSPFFEIGTALQKVANGFRVGDARIGPSDFVRATLVFIIGYVITRFIKSLLRTMILPRTTLEKGLRNTVASLFGYVGYSIATIVAINSLGVDLSSVALIASALSVGVGFAVGNIVSNFVSGLIILIERPIVQGDWISIGGQQGYVSRISVRSTTVETFDNAELIIPNEAIVTGTVTNFTHSNLVGRLRINVGVSYSSDTQHVSDVLLEIARAQPMVLLTPPPNVQVLDFGDSAIVLQLRAVLRDFNFVVDVQTAIMHEIKRRFDEEGIEIPFPQRDIWVHADVNPSPKSS